MIFLIGMMGSGKSTIGRLLALSLGCDFTDTDHEIENRHMKIHKLVKQLGLDAFRDFEHQVLMDVIKTSSKQSVIATGGGIILKKENREVIHETGATVIYLKNSIPSLIRHLKQDDLTKRPLLSGQLHQTLERLHNDRSPLYEGMATVTITCDHLTKEAIIEQICHYLRMSDC